MARYDAPRAAGDVNGSPQLSAANAAPPLLTTDGPEERIAALCDAVEARVRGKLEALVATTMATGPTTGPAGAAATPHVAFTPMGPASAVGANAPVDNLASAWPCTVHPASGPSRRRRSVSVSGSELGARRSHRSSPGHRGAMSTRSHQRAGHHRHGDLTASLLKRIERLESLGTGGEAAAASGPGTVHFPEAPRRPAGSKSPPLSAERRFLQERARGPETPGAEALNC